LKGKPGRYGTEKRLVTQSPWKREKSRVEKSRVEKRKEEGRRRGGEEEREEGRERGEKSDNSLVFYGGALLVRKRRA